MSDTTDLKSDVTDSAAGSPARAPAQAGTTRRRRTGTGLQAMLLSELQALAASLGISGTARMRKGELIAAIQVRQRAAGESTTGAGTSEPAAATATVAESNGRGVVDSGKAEQEAPTRAEQQTLPGTDTPVAERTERRTTRRATRPAGPPEQRRTSSGERVSAETDTTTVATADGQVQAESQAPAEGQAAEPVTQTTAPERTPTDGVEEQHPVPREEAEESGGRAEGARDDEGRGEGRPTRGRDRAERTDRSERGERTERAAADRDRDEEEGESSGRRRRGRFRDRRARARDRGSADGEPTINEDDVLVPIAGIVDVLDNYAFIRTSGYLAGPHDVYVSMGQVRKYGLRRGDVVTGAVRQNREGEQRRDKYNPLVRLDTINGMDPEEAKHRPEFYKLTPLYPQERLRLETEPHILTTRVIDLIAPIGKGQRALIVSPPKAGKTMVLQAIANGITRNSPECHLMVVLVDERPEEVTDMQRSVKGEVIASTFDRPPSDHTTVAELSIERAKRLVELGHDVVVLLDSITRLGRSYNLAAPASGRIMSGGIDSTALYPPKRFLGAARNIENGGSLTIIATALVETGSVMDTVIFEEFKGTGNCEIKLDRKLADKRMFPAVDVDASSTRREEILLAPEELQIVHKLRRVLSSLDSQQALDLLLDRLKKTKTNVEFLMQIQKSTPGE